MVNPQDAVLGRVNAVVPGSAWVEPLLVHENGKWVDPVAEDFQPDGTVFWPHLPFGIEEDAIVAFRVRHGTDKHEWIVEQQITAHPVVDVGDSTYGELFRIWHSRPLKRVVPRTATEACFSVSEGFTLGPVKGKHTTDGFELDDVQGLDRIEASRDATSIVDLGVHGSWFVPLQRDPLGFRVDCRSDPAVLKSALIDTADALKQTIDASIPPELSTRKAISDAVDSVSRKTTDERRVQRLKRSQEILKNWDKGYVQVLDIADEITQLPAVATAVHDAQTEAAAAATLRAQDEFEKRNAEAQARLESARAEHDALQVESARLRADLDRAEDIVRSRLVELSEDASSVLAENVLARALLPQQLPAPGTPTVRRLNPVFASPPPGCRTLDTKAFSKVAGSDGIVAETLLRIHAAHGAGLLPIVIGANAQLALATYARIAVADRIVSLPVAHDFLHPVDLLGIRAETGELSRPHGDLLRVANDEVSGKTPGLLVLEGLNRGATESYLAPWLTRMDQSIALGESAQSAVQTDAFIRSADLLLAATAINGSTAAPLGPDLWGRAVVIDVRHWTIFDITHIPRTWIYTQTVRSPKADETAKEIRRSVMAPLEPWWHIDSSILNAVESYARSLAADAGSGNVDTGSIRTTIAECVLLPSLTTSLGHESVQSAVETLAKWASPKDKSLPARLRRRADRIAQVLS